ncbi:hypothetical protein GDO81_027255 [Engystomops pustulosus]|uniref:Uncharacterized protein n=1 Tax=Engystomops pustulosus TaxID=76066 RepID=A0AAV6YL70_ENGPU|nr:hypothetical protein GDO81_027255 [Engystomops pustulosus]
MQPGDKDIPGEEAEVAATGALGLYRVGPDGWRREHPALTQEVKVSSTGALHRITGSALLHLKVGLSPGSSSDKSRCIMYDICTLSLPPGAG